MSAAPRGQVCIELCGEVRVEIDGRRRERDLPGRLGRILLGYLALNRRRAVPRGELVDVLWPRQPPQGAAGTLSTLLSGLRRALGAELIQGRAELRLVLPADADVDVERAVAAIESARESGDPQVAAALAETALEVLERTLLPGFDAPWLEDRRLEVEDQRLDALELLARAGLAAGGPGVHRAHAAARRLVALAPYRESGYALLMEAQAQRGNVAEALRTFERLRSLMRDELGTTPSAALRDAHARLLELAEDEAAPPAAPLPTPLARVAGRAFVGRGSAIARLRDQLAATGAGQRRFAFLAGEPGIGKTSLAAAFAAEARAAGATVLYGRSEEEPLVPYQPFVDAIWHWVSHGGLDDLGPEHRPEVEELGRLVPHLRGRLAALREPPSAAPDVERYRMFEAVIVALSHAAGRGTLVLVLDDLHWSDRPTLRLLRHIARAAAPERLLVIGTYRDAELARDAPLHGLIADLRREHVFERVSLAGLEEDEIGELVQAHGLSSESAERLHELTGGNPLFLDEMLQAVAEGGDPERALAEIGVPDGVREVVLGRVDRLGGEAREVLTRAAVAGQTFRVAALEEGGSVVQVLERALEARLLAQAERPDLLSFSHALIRKTLYRDMSDTRRVELHRLAAEQLEERRAELRAQPAELAHHFFEARHLTGPEPAIRYAREAAERAAESLAWEQAALHVERALEAEELREPRDRGDRCELLLALGEMRLRAGHGAARAAFAEAADLARGRSPEQLGRAAIGYGGRYYEAGVVDPELVAMLSEALAALPEDDADLRTRVLARLAEVLHFAGETETAIELSARAVELAARLGDDEVLAAALAGRHVSLLHVAHLDERLDVSARLLGLGGDPERELQAIHARIFDLIESGDLPEARRSLERLEAVAHELRQPLFEHFAVGWSCAFAQLDGRLDDAERLAAESFAMRRRLETEDAEAVFAAQLFTIRHAQGRLGELLPAVSEAMDRYPALAAWRAALPLVRLAAGDERGAREELDRLVAGVDSIARDFFWLTAVSLLAEAAGSLRAAEPAERLYPLLAPYSKRLAQVGYAASFGPVARFLGGLAAARGDTAAAIGHLEVALDLCAASGAAAYEVSTRADLAGVLAEAGGHAAAEAMAAEALAGAERLGMAGIVARLGALNAA